MKEARRQWSNDFKVLEKPDQTKPTTYQVRILSLANISCRNEGADHLTSRMMAAIRSIFKIHF